MPMALTGGEVFRPRRDGSAQNIDRRLALFSPISAMPLILKQVAVELRMMRLRNFEGHSHLECLVVFEVLDAVYVPRLRVQELL